MKFERSPNVAVTLWSVDTPDAGVEVGIKIVSTLKYHVNVITSIYISFSKEVINKISAQKNVRFQEITKEVIQIFNFKKIKSRPVPKFSWITGSIVWRYPVLHRSPVA